MRDPAMILKQKQMLRKLKRDLPPPPESGLGPVYTIPASACSVAGFADWYLAGNHSKYGKVGYIGGDIYVEDLVRDALFWLPRNAFSPEGFRDWALSGEYPPHGKVQYIGGEIYVDMNAEAINTHVKVKLEFTRVVANLAIENNLGLVYSDGALVRNDAADLSNQPDLCFCSWQTLKAGQMREVVNRKGEVQSLEGSPDLVLEILSNKSVNKDTKVLIERYFRAGVQEYWLIDARRGRIDFRVLTRGKTKFVAQPRRGGWVLSPLFQRRFSLQRRDYEGFWRYELLAAPLVEKRKPAKGS